MPQGVLEYNKIFQTPALFQNILLFIFVYLPILFHGFYGLILLKKTKHNALTYPHFQNTLFTLHHITAFLSLGFILFHVYELKINPTCAEGARDYLCFVSYFQAWWKVGIYILGVTSVFFHFCYGAWNFLVNWGILISQKSRKIFLGIFFALFFFLSFTSILVILKMTYHYKQAPWVIEKVIDLF